MKYFVVVLGIVMLFAAGCDTQKSANRTEPGLSDSSNRPDAEVKGAKISLYEKGRVTNIVDAKRIVRFDLKDSTIGYQVNIKTLDSTGKVISTLVGDSSLTRENTGHFSVYGNVVAVGENGTRLETDYLHWNPDIHKIQTDAFVKITQHSNVITGWGMEATEKLTDVKILKQVSGSFRDTSLAGEK